jgi:plasmid stabilization system protein ParE
MTYSFHPEAAEEFRAAVEYYEDREAGLGNDFSLEVFAAIRNVLAHPSAWPIIEDDVRRCLVNRFPFAVLYSLEETGDFILAVMHGRRRPDYWIKRR